MIWISDSLKIPLKTKADLALTPSIRKEPIYLKDNENNFVPSIKFSQSYQIRNEQISPVTDIKVEIHIHMWRMLVIELMSPRNDQSHQDDLVDDFSCNWCCVGALWLDKIEDDWVTQNWCQRRRNDQEANRNFCSQLTRWPQYDQDHDEVNTMQLIQDLEERQNLQLTRFSIRAGGNPGWSNLSTMLERKLF